MGGQEQGPFPTSLMMGWSGPELAQKTGARIMFESQVNLRDSEEIQETLTL